MKNDREIYFQSERTGYSHLYTRRRSKAASRRR